jgi:UDP-glucose 4-epimerase
VGIVYMIKHLNKTASKPSRVVVLGGKGFIGATITKQLEADGINTLSIGRAEIDLLKATNEKKLTCLLEHGDTLIIAAALAPVKEFSLLLDNINMLRPIIFAAHQVSLSHVIYVSSDAVYSDSPTPLTEISETNPGSLHGIMHKTRELVIQSEISKQFDIPLCIIRPTLIYGTKDPHNGYGPNKFLRLAFDEENIPVFGMGEERRDHVSVNDVANLAVQIVLQKSSGILNIASGRTTSFRTIAEQIILLTKKPLQIIEVPRIGNMPHNGFRPFDPEATKLAFPDFNYTEIIDGLSKIVESQRTRL